MLSRLELFLKAILHGRFLTLICRLHSHRTSLGFEEGVSVEVNSSGAYPTVCIELSLDGLAVNAVLQVKAWLFFDAQA